MTAPRNPFETILSPLPVGRLTLPNRIVMPALFLAMTKTGEISDEIVAFYRERARGGAGLIIVGGCPIDDYAGNPFMPLISKDSHVAGHRMLTDAVHEEGGLVGAQLYHGGRYVHSMLIGGKKAMAPSAIYSPFTHEEPAEMTQEDIDRTVDAFGQAARRTKEAGYDAVEILGSAGYLLSQFLSPVTNKRTDKYGGSLEARLTFPKEVIAAVRGAVGDDFTVIYRIAGNDLVPGSNSWREAAVVARTLEEQGIDAINVTAGWHEATIPQLPFMVPRGAFVHLAREIKRVVSIPVMACNRINDPALGEQILRCGYADLVGIGRGLVADPWLPTKIAHGDEGTLVHCVACNQGCLDRIFQLQPLRCMVNPRAGKELEEAAAEEITGKKKVLVVGGGPAGLAAAEAAAARGHQVILCEANDEVGGQLRTAGKVPDKEHYADMADDLLVQAESRGVEVRRGVRVDRAYVQTVAPDVVVVATGAKPGALSLPVEDDTEVVSAWEVLQGRSVVGQHVVVVGAGGTGLDVAIYLSRQGTLDPETIRFLLVQEALDPADIRRMALDGCHEVTIVEMLKKGGKGVGKSTKWALLKEVDSLGVTLLTNSSLDDVTNGVATVTMGDETKEIPCDTVVLATGLAPDRELADQLEGLPIELKVVGDASGVANAFQAIQDGYEVGMGI